MHKNLPLRLSDHDKINIVQLYKTGKYTCVDIGKMYNKHKSSIARLLDRRGIKVLNDQSQLQRKYTLDHSFFDDINTEAKAYFLGLLYADGYNCETKHSITLCLQSKDKTILEQFSKHVQSNKPLYFYNRKKKNKNWSNIYILSMCSKQMSTKLKKLGCHQGKTFTLKFPTKQQVPEKFLSHFVRGYFDGDGYCGKRIKGKYLPSFSVSIVSTDQFCQKLSQYIKKHINVNTYIRKRHKNRKTTTRQLEIQGNLQVERFLRWIYQDSTIFLNRKFLKFQQLQTQNANRLIKTDSH